MILAEGPETVAAFFAEPVMGAGGVIVPPATYFEKIQNVLHRYDVLLIADEVICGFGRTGSMWGSQTFGLKPDIVTCAKALSASYLPISATMVSEEVYRGLLEGSRRLGVFGHGYTYSGHPVTAAAALAALDIYEEIDVVSVVRRTSRRFLDRLHGFGAHPLVGETRGVGLVGAIELTSDKATRTPFPPEMAVGPAVVAAAQQKGLVLRSMINDTISFCPPLIIADDEIDMMFDRFEAALEDVALRIGTPASKR
jgi:4-aminobutyrate--pyruvate transaminase